MKVKLTKTLSFVLILVCILSLLLTSACTQKKRSPSYLPLENSSFLPKANITLTIPSLTTCTHNSDTTLHLNNQEPVIIIVHGCFSSGGRFRALADVFAFHVQQAICFEYDDRQSLHTSSGLLVDAINGLSKEMPESTISIIGHSQGGLVSRHALTGDRDDQKQVKAKSIALTTVSTPFAGIEASSHCGSTLLTILTLGLVKPICHLITGQKYKEIPPTAEFINQPGIVIPQVSKHNRLATDETNSCREFDDQGRCREDDYVFSVNEQVNSYIDSDSRVKPFVVKAGHVEIIGNESKAPEKLIEYLQKEKVMKNTPARDRIAFKQLLKQLYAGNYDN